MLGGARVPYSSLQKLMANKKQEASKMCIMIYEHYCITYETQVLCPPNTQCGSNSESICSHELMSQPLHSTPSISSVHASLPCPQESWTSRENAAEAAVLTSVSLSTKH